MTVQEIVSVMMGGGEATVISASQGQDVVSME